MDQGSVIILFFLHKKKKKANHNLISDLIQYTCEILQKLEIFVHTNQIKMITHVSSWLHLHNLICKKLWTNSVQFSREIK